MTNRKQGACNATQANPTFTKLSIAGVANGGNRSVTDIEFEPGNPNTLLTTVVGGGASGAAAGVYRTTNALDPGPTFARTLAVGDTTTLYRTELAVNKVGTQVTVFAATSESNGTLKRSTSGGATWSAALGGTGFCGGQCTYDIPVAVDPDNANLVHLGGPGDSGSAHILTKVTNALLLLARVRRVPVALHLRAVAREVVLPLPTRQHPLFTGARRRPPARPSPRFAVIPVIRR